MECELLRSPMISYRSLLYNTTVLYDAGAAVIIIQMAGSNFLELYSNTFFTLHTIRVPVNFCYTQGQIWDLLRGLPSVLNQGVWGAQPLRSFRVFNFL